MSSLSRRACFKCGNVGHYAGKPHPGKANDGARCCDTFGSNCREMALWRVVPAARGYEPSGDIYKRTRD